MHTSKSVQPPLIFSANSGAADLVGAGRLGLVDLVALGEDHRPQRPADAVRQHDRAADQLVGLLGVDPQPHDDLDGLVELRGVEGLQQPTASANGNGACRRPFRRAFIRFDCFTIVHLSLSLSLWVAGIDRRAQSAFLAPLSRRLRISSLSHQSITSSPMLRAVPSTMRRAWSRSRAFRSAIFCLARFPRPAPGHLAHLLLVRHARALGDPRRLLQQRRGRRALRHELEACGRCTPCTTTGIGMPPASLVRSLNCCTNCPRLMPNGPTPCPPEGPESPVRRAPGTSLRRPIASP